MLKTIATVFIYALVCNAQYAQYRVPKQVQAAATGSSSYQETPYAASSARRPSSAYRVVPSGQYGDTVEAVQEVKPIPYTFGYDTSDEYGTKVTRAESSDGSGAIKGSYSYIDPAGVTRTVEYIADDNGFRATINTNEPGTQKSNPSNALINANPLQVVAIQPVEPSQDYSISSAGKSDARVVKQPRYKLVAPTGAVDTQPEYAYTPQAERPQPTYKLVAPAQAVQPEYTYSAAAAPQSNAAQQDYSYDTARQSVQPTGYAFSIPASQVAPQSAYSYETPSAKEAAAQPQTSYASADQTSGQQYGYQFSVPAYDSPTPAPQTAYKVDASQAQVAAADQQYLDSLPDAVKQLLSQRYSGYQ